MTSSNVDFMTGPQFEKRSLHLDTAISNLYDARGGRASSRFGAGNQAAPKSEHSTAAWSKDDSANDHSSINERQPHSGLPENSNSMVPAHPGATTQHILSHSSLGMPNGAILSQNSLIVSPLETHLDRHNNSPSFNAAYDTSNISYGSESPKQQHFYKGDNQTHWSYENSHGDTNTSKGNGRGGTSKRKRESEDPEPGSARAIYLEKNRQAASKCRSKQKRHQEELVEAARHYERRNKLLKAEVEMLKTGMRELMDIVGQHSDCSDDRLKLYIQREANRLATSGRRSSIRSP